MKKIVILFLITFFTLPSFSQNLVDKQEVLAELTNRLTIIQSEMETCKVRIKINKNDFDAIALLAAKKEETKQLKQNVKFVKNAIKTEKKTSKLLSEYQKLMAVLLSDNEKVIYIKKHLQ